MAEVTTLYHQKGSSAYRTVHQQSMSDREMMAHALHTLIGWIYQAKTLYAEHRLDLMTQQNARTIRVLIILRETLTQSNALSDLEARNAALAMISTYNAVLLRLANIVLASDVEAEYEAVIALLKPLHEAWRGI